MRFLFGLLILLSLLGCDTSRDIIVEPPSRTILWIGEMTATYPGPDCGPITVTDSIKLILLSYKFMYYWHNGVTFDTIAAGEGTYSLDNCINFTNEITPSTNPPLTIDGTFNLGYVSDTMILSQGLSSKSSSFFETIYYIELVGIDEMPE